MKYLIMIAALLIFSGADSARIENVTSQKKEQKSPSSYLSITAYQQDYSELQQKSVKVNSKVKKILNQVKRND